MDLLVLLVKFAIYIILGRWMIRHLSGAWRDGLFGLLNLAGVYILFFHSKPLGYFLLYVGLVIIQYGALRIFSRRNGGWPWLAFLIPILALVLVRYGSPDFYAKLKLPDPSALYFVGISYLAFRSSLLVLQVRNGQVALPNFARYLSFCLFIPTLQVGPISPYTEFNRALNGAPVPIPVGRAALRMFVGAIKYQFLGTFCSQLTYSGLLLDYHFHPWMDLPVAVVAYYLFLYCNFSGFCDMAIGAAGLMGIPVAENFDHPFAARNVKDFWNRWHITLSVYMRDVVFSPVSKFFVRLFGPANANHAIALTITIVFLLIGIWHGVGWNYFIYGAIHAFAVVINHYYTIGLKKWLGREGFKAYNENRWIHAAAVILTFAYCAASLMFFANTIPQIKEIFSVLR